MADQRITELVALPKASVAATDVLPIADISATQTKKVTVQDLVDAGLDLIAVSSIDLNKLDQASTTKLGATALATNAVTAAKLADSSSISVGTTAPASDNFQGRGFYNTTSGALQVYSAGAFAAVNATIAAGSVTTAGLADGAVTTAKASSLGTAALANSAVTYAKIQNVSATDKLLGRSTAGAGVVEEINCTSAGRNLIAGADAAAQRATLGLGTLATQSGTVSGTHTGSSSGTNTGDQTITLTGDVTGSGTGSFAATVAAAAITEAKLGALSVSTAKIQNDAVTAIKLADNSAAVVAAAVPSGTGAFIGQQWVNTNTAIEYTWDGSTWQRQASLGTIVFTDATPLNFTVSYPDAYSANINAALDNQTANVIFAGPTTGSDAAPTFRALTAADLPAATSVAKGAVLPGTGLSISSGTLNHLNTTTAGTATKVTFDAQGHISSGTTLIASDIPVLDTSKITTGTFGSAVIADDAITSAKLANYSTAQIGSALPVAAFIGQFFLNPLERTVYMWDGNVWQPVGITAGTVIFAGTYDASTNFIASVTGEGAALGLSVGNALPAASVTNQNYFVIVSNAGTGVAPAPTVPLLPPDLILSTGTSWVRIESSDAYIAQVATQVSFTPAGQVSSSNVQAAIEEVSTECRVATNITSGTLAPTVGGTGITTYAKGDVIAGSGTNTLAKLTVGTNGFVLKANSSTATGLQWAAYDALVTGGGTMTGNLEMGTGTTIIFEGATADIYETVLTVVDPTADRTITLPNATGTVALTSDLDDGTY